MIGNLTEKQVEELLHNEVVGRIGCHTQKMVYVVPISYVYDGQSIYGHTYDGLKINTMRANPEVCFEVDNLKDMGNWQSVIAWGTYEEITDSRGKEKALKLLLNRSLPVISSSTTHLGNSWPFSDDSDTIDGILFRIVLKKKTGKFETSSESPSVNG